MKTTKAVFIAIGILMICLFQLPKASADQWNKKTKVTFSQPVEVPGVGTQILPAGTYVFELVDSLSDRHIVRIFSEDKTQIFTTILAIPNYRLRPADKTILTFRERAAGSPQALRAWFFPGETWGHEFVYPKARAVELAKTTHEPVLETPTELADQPMEFFKTAPVDAVEPSGKVVEEAQVVETPPVAGSQPIILPQTASPLPLIGLTGLLALGASIAVSFVRKLVVTTKRA